MIAGGFLPLLLTQEGGEGRGEEVVLLSFPSLRLSPHSFLAGRENLCRYQWLKPGANEMDALTLRLAVRIFMFA
jgi:hypothetical protein